MDVRLVKGEEPDRKFEQWSSLRKQGFYVTAAEPPKKSVSLIRNRSRSERPLQLSRVTHIDGASPLAGPHQSGPGRTNHETVIAPLSAAASPCTFLRICKSLDRRAHRQLTTITSTARRKSSLGTSGAAWNLRRHPRRPDW